MKKSVAIVYGWSEGPWQSKRFRKQLSNSGFVITKDPTAADIVVAHSLGCYLVPHHIKARLIVLIGPGFWPDKSLFRAVTENMKVGMSQHHREGEIKWWLNKLAHNFWYVLTRPTITFLLIKRNAKHDFLPHNIGQRKILLVRNEKDTFLHPNIQELLPKTRPYRLIKMPGGHEDCWVNPERYIDLLLKEL